MTLTEMTAALNAKYENFGTDYAGHYDMSTEEAERIAAKSKTADEFEKIWENECWWTDEQNA